MSINKYDAHFYGDIATRNPATELPPQALPDSQKTENWKKATADALERIGVIQFRENLKFRDFYRMVEGKMSYMELAEVIPQLREVEKTLDDFDIPSYLKHYDIIGILVNALAGELSRSGDKFHVTNIDEIATNEYIRTKEDLLQGWVKEEFNKELQLKMIQKGIDPFKTQFKSEEEKQEYMQFLQQQREMMTPPEIEDYMNRKWKPAAVKWGEYTLDADREKYSMDMLDRDEFIDYLLTGRCFRHYRIGYDFYKPERWSPKNTFFSQDLETSSLEDAEYVGRVHFFTPAQIVNRYPDLMSEKQKREFLSKNRNSDYNQGGAGASSQSFSDLLENQFHERRIVPFSNYYDHKFLTGLEDTFGVPAATKTMWNKDGSSTTIPAFLPRTMGEVPFGHQYAMTMRDDLNLRHDLIQVTEGYFLSFKRIAYLTFETESGRLETVRTTDDLLPDIIKEYKIKQIHTATLEEVENNPQKDTLVYDYIPEWYEFVKISNENIYLQNPIYRVRPLEYQIRGNSEFYDLKCPVVGIISETSFANKLQPYQVGINVANNQIYNLMEKEIGLFFLFDINFLPSEFKDYGDTEEALMHLRSIAKNLGLFPIDASKGNTHLSNFNQFSAQNVTFSTQIQDRIQLAEYFTQKAFQTAGISSPRLGTPSKYETAEGVRQGLDASYAQTEGYFDTFFAYKKRALETHLTIAQYCQTNSKDITVFYTKSDATKAFLKFTDDDFHLRKFGILPTSNAKKRKELEQFKSYLLQTNTLGADELDLAMLISGDSMSEVIEIARQSRNHRQQEAQVEHERMLEQSQLASQLEEQKEEKKWQREEFSNEKDRENRIEVKRIDALGRALDNDASMNSLEQINKEADLALQKQRQDKELELREAESARKDKQISEDKEFRMAELNLKMKELAYKVQANKDENFRAVINKN